jgi:hypothetical protein
MRLWVGGSGSKNGYIVLEDDINYTVSTVWEISISKRKLPLTVQLRQPCESNAHHGRKYLA